MPVVKSLNIHLKIQEKMKRISALYGIKVETIAEISTHDQIDAFRSVCANSAIGAAMLIDGQIGTGKSTIANAYCDRQNWFGGRKSGMTPLLISMSEQTTPDSLSDAILGELESAYVKTRENNFEHCGYLLREKYGACLVCDSSEIVFNDTEKFAEILTWLQHLSQVYAIAMVFVCNGHIREKANGFCRYHDFITDCCRIESIMWKRAGDDFQELLQSIDDKLPFSRHSCLAEKTIAQKVFSATAGKIGLVIMLVKTAGWIAITNEKPTIDKESLEIAMELLIAAMQLTGGGDSETGMARWNQWKLTKVQMK
jgi:hypothetical protein